MSALSDIEIQRSLGSLPGWSRKGEALTKTYHFAAFPDGIAFIARVAEIAEKMNHHPDIDIRWNRVTLVLSTHSERGLTQNDFELAHRINDVAGQET